MTDTQRKKEGFDGQRAIVLPRKIIEQCERMDLVNNVFITDIGFYPKAKFHFRERQHGISQYILIYCTDGSGWVKFKGKKIELPKHHFLVIPTSTPHTYGSDEEQPWTIYWIHFKGRQAQQFVDTLTARGSSRAIPYSDQRTKLFDTIYCTLESGYGYDNLSYVNLSLWHFLASLCYPDIFVLPEKKENKDIIEISIEFIRQNLDRIIGLKELAALVNLSASHYSALFKKKTGYPPLEYINHIKIQKACQYLHFTDILVKEVAGKLGIDDPYYFSRLFSTVMGISPIEYRKRMRQ